MKIFVFIVLCLSITPAYADGLMQQRNEIIRQQHELDALRDDSVRQKRALEQQSIEHEQEMRQLRREQKNTLDKQRQDAEIQGIIDDWNNKQDYQEAIKESDKHAEYLRLKAENEEAATRSTIILDDRYYAQLASTLSQKEFTRSQINRITESHKSFVLRMADKAEHGNKDAQYKLAMLFSFGRGVSIDYDRAASLLIKAAENGHQEAQSKLDAIHRINKQNR